MNNQAFGDKPYNDLNTYLRKTFGHKVYKLSLSGGITCPNRDGSAGTGGCIFCSRGGSGDFAAPSRLSVSEQLSYGKQLIASKRDFTPDCRYIAYFQSFTNTYMPSSFLDAHGLSGHSPADWFRPLFEEALADPDVCALSIGTRPDCLDPETVRMLTELNSVKPVWVELGLQTIHDPTADFIRRGYPLTVFEDALHRLRSAGLTVIVHLILGLPDEDRDMMLSSVRYLAHCDIQGIKLQLLHILSDTDLGEMYLNDPGFTAHLKLGTPDDYIALLADALRILSPDTVIHRLTGDGPHDLLLYPMWSANKRTTLNGLLKYMRDNGYEQGDLFHKQ